MNRIQFSLIALGVAALAAPLSAKDSLGVFGNWGAFRDPETPRCYAIAMAAPSTLQRDYEPYASIGTWPEDEVRNQVHFRMSRRMASGASVTLRISGREFAMTGRNGDAWAKDQRMDAAIVAAMRSAGSMVIRSTGANGQRFSNTYDLSGAATAMDAATVGCANLS